MAVTAVVVLSACGSNLASPSTSLASPDPTQTPSPSDALETPSATPTSSPSAEGLVADSLAMVVTNDLVVRSLPEISDRSTIDPDYLQQGHLLFVLEGPERADGYDWYRVAPIDDGDDIVEPAPLLGWVAAGSRDGEPWIESATEHCIEQEGNPYWVPGPRALACMGGREIAIEGTVIACAGSSPGGVEPAWFDQPIQCMEPEGWQSGELGSPIPTFRIAPNGPAMPGPGAAIRIVGHLDDPAAQDCEVVHETGEKPVPPEIVVLRCRATLVVTEVTALDR